MTFTSLSSIAGALSIGHSDRFEHHTVHGGTKDQGPHTGCPIRALANRAPLQRVGNALVPLPMTMREAHLTSCVQIRRRCMCVFVMGKWRRARRSVIPPYYCNDR
jgi:hypothetical protein